jgi:hypothetical protein
VDITIPWILVTLTLVETIANIEGCNSVISTKSTLNGTELIDSIDNLEPVPILKNLNYSLFRTMLGIL